DLNFENPAVHEALRKVLDFWLQMGVDGLRLDAVPYLFEAEGTNCENLPATHHYLKQLRKYIDDNYDDRMLLAEANQWPEDAASYFGDGDECHMNFHFPLMPRMFMAVHQENNFPILDILEQTPDIPDNCQWAIFLRNHDELTLEMVTDEDRDYMYRVYAEDPRARINLGIRRRLAPLLRERRKLELMTGMLLSLPGTPVLYYGDEIGMGDNYYLGDRDAVRTPMQWSGDRNAGFSRANPQKLFLPVIIDPEYHYEAINVEAQQGNPESLLWWTKRILDLRKHHQVFGRGTVEFLQPDNPKVLAFIREYQDERVLVVVNLSRYSQFVELDLSRFSGIAPIELFGHTEFPRIGELPYLLTMSPHGFYWLDLGDREETADDQLPTVYSDGDWRGLLEGRKPALLAALEAFLPKARWFRSKSRRIRRLVVRDVQPLGDSDQPVITLIDVEFSEGDPETYLLPVALTTGEHQEAVFEHHPQAVIARVEGAQDGIVYDASIAPGFADAVLEIASSNRRLAGRSTRLAGVPSPRLQEIVAESPSASRAVDLEQTNTTLVFGETAVLKLFRRIERGTNPDVEVSAALTEAGFEHSPPYGGHLELAMGSGEPAVAGIVSGFVSNQGDAWSFTLDRLARYFDDALSSQHDANQLLSSLRSDPARLTEAVPEPVSELIGDYLPLARLLGERCAELHLALLQNSEAAAFAPLPFSTLHQRSLFQSGRAALKRGLDKLSRNLRNLEGSTAEIAERVLSQRSQLEARLRRIVGDKIDAVRIRCHGDLHLGQVLYTGNDFIIIDFEGEPGRTIGERRIKRSPLRDVAGMLRSFHYAAVAARHGEHVREEDDRSMQPWDEVWHRWVSAVFLSAYLQRASGSAFLPRQESDLETLLDFYWAEKCIYELSYELDNRPDWLAIPLAGLADLLEP
ncbi:MAG: putative maltokinase, partial [Deltaproteobacteria bacterium]|nr:putative maltokinase [Deltaproteobacteria bacterium]